MRVVIPRRNRAKDPKIRVSRDKAYELVEQFECPNNIKIGKCLTPNNYLNNFNNNIEGVWLFELIDNTPNPIKKTKPKPKKTSKPRRKALVKSKEE